MNPIQNTNITLLKAFGVPESMIDRTYSAVLTITAGAPPELVLHAYTSNTAIGAATTSLKFKLTPLEVDHDK